MRKLRFSSALKLNLTRKYSNNVSYIHRLENDPLKFLTVGQLLKITADKYSDREAVISCEEKRKITFGEALDKVATGVFNHAINSTIFIGGQTCKRLIESWVEQE